MSELRENFLKATGLTFDIDKAISKLSDDQKQKFFNKLVWLMPGGEANNKGERGKLIANIIVDVAKELDIELTGDINGDGKINKNDERIASRVEVLTSEEPGENKPTEGPTTDPKPNPEDPDDLEVKITSEGEAIVGNTVVLKVSITSKKYEGAKIYVKINLTPADLAKLTYNTNELSDNSYVFGEPGNGITLTSSEVSSLNAECLSPGELALTFNVISDDTRKVIGEGKFTLDIKAKEETVEPEPEPTEPEPAEPEIENAEDLVEAIENGGEVKVEKSIDVPEVLKFDKESTLILGEDVVIKPTYEVTDSNAVAGAENNNTIMVKSGDVKIEGGVIETVNTENLTNPDTILGKAAGIKVEGGKLTLKDVKVVDANPVYIPDGDFNAEVVIESGDYQTTNASQAVYVGSTNGKVVIKDGKFYARPWPTSSGDTFYCLNLKDSLLTGSDEDLENADLPRKFIEVSGGTFVGFNPADSKVESSKLKYSPVSFVAPGYKVIEDGTETVKSNKSEQDLTLTVYKVVEDK